jgi:hypothetical protein
MRLVVKFGEKKRYSDQECQELIEAGLNNEARPDPDALRRFSGNSTPPTRLRQQGAISQTLR